MKKPTFGQRIVMKFYGASREEAAGLRGPTDASKLAAMIDTAHNTTIKEQA